MLAVVKMHHTNFTIQGSIPAKLLNYLRQEYGEKLQIKEQEVVVVKKTAWYKKMQQQAKPGEAIRIYRQNNQWTQADLGKKIGVSKYRVSDLENHRRAVSKQLAKQLASLFGVAVERFI